MKKMNRTYILLCYIYGEDKESCMHELRLLIDRHRVRCTYYTFVKDENRTDGEWIGRENKPHITYKKRRKENDKKTK